MVAKDRIEKFEEVVEMMPEIEVFLRRLDNS